MIAETIRLISTIICIASCVLFWVIKEEKHPLAHMIIEFVLAFSSAYSLGMTTAMMILT